MPLVLPDAFHLGQTARLTPKDRRSSWCHVVAPDGQEFKIKTTRGMVAVLLLQQGVWRYSFSKSDRGELAVANPPPPEPLEPPPPVVERRVPRSVA